jgi:hypothetical protein
MGSFEKPPPGPPQNFLLNKSFCGVQGRFFQKEPLAAGGSNPDGSEPDEAVNLNLL